MSACLHHFGQETTSNAERSDCAERRKSRKASLSTDYWISQLPRHRRPRQPKPRPALRGAARRCGDDNAAAATAAASQAAWQEGTFADHKAATFWAKAPIAPHPPSQRRARAAQGPECSPSALRVFCPGPGIRVSPDAIAAGATQRRDRGGARADAAGSPAAAAADRRAPGPR